MLCSAGWPVALAVMLASSTATAVSQPGLIQTPDPGDLVGMEAAGDPETVVPLEIQPLDGVLFYSSGDDAHGNELWRTDGTASGTYMVKDINPGPANGEVQEIVVAGDYVFFRAFHPSYGYEVWFSDGTEAGTQLLKDISPSVFPNYKRPYVLEEAGGQLFFRHHDGAHGYELWRSDGTAAGTYMVKDFLPGNNTSYPSHGIEWMEQLYFPADDGVHGYELWRSDGTGAGTVMVADINPGSGSTGMTIWNAVELLGNLYFIADDGTHGFELWRTDGTAPGTTMVGEIYPGTCAVGCGAESMLGVVDDLVYLQADGGVYGSELWRSDGTAAGTELVADIKPGSGASNPDWGITLGNLLLFSASGPEGIELWRSDGTEAGTELVLDIWPGTCTTIQDFEFPCHSHPYPWLELDGIVLFTAKNEEYGGELWRTDGTTAGTYVVRDLNPDPTYTGGAPLGVLNGKVIFFGDDGAGNAGLWVTDGTELGTYPVSDGGPPGPFDDVAGDSIFADDIAWLAAEGITKGCNPPDNTEFCPKQNVTREQMAAFLVRALGYTDDGGGDIFIDDDESIFEADIDKLATAGVTKGCDPPDNTEFCPKQNVTREQMAAFLHRALGD